MDEEMKKLGEWVAKLDEILDEINAAKAGKRKLSVAATELETAILWLGSQATDLMVESMK